MSFRMTSAWAWAGGLPPLSPHGQCHVGAPFERSTQLFTMRWQVVVARIVATGAAGEGDSPRRGQLALRQQEEGGCEVATAPRRWVGNRGGTERGIWNDP